MFLDVVSKFRESVRNHSTSPALFTRGSLIASRFAQEEKTIRGKPVCNRKLPPSGRALPTTVNGLPRPALCDVGSCGTSSLFGRHAVCGSLVTKGLWDMLGQGLFDPLHSMGRDRGGGGKIGNQTPCFCCRGSFPFPPKRDGGRHLGGRRKYRRGSKSTMDYKI